MKSSWKAGTLAIGLSLALALAACTPADGSPTPQSTNQAETPGAIVTQPGDGELTPETTAVMPTDVVPTEALATAGPTQEAMTPEATMAATSEPEGEGMPSMLLSTELVGSQVVDLQGAEVGSVLEVLVSDSGAVQYVIVDATFFLAGLNASATADPLATPDPDVLNEGVVAAPLSAFEINTLGTVKGEIDDDQVLVYQATNVELMGMAGFDLAVFDQDGFIIDTTDTTLDASFNGLIRVSEFSDWNLVNAADQDLGEVEDLVIDLEQEMVVFGIVDFGGFLGIGEKSTAVPWELFVIEQNADADTHFQLDVTQETLENAPVVDLGAWPAWHERVETNADWSVNWETDARTFWEAAASS